jgi:AraC-like DNA-binding protein
VKTLDHSKPASSSLLKYIDSYAHFYHDDEENKLYKNILPCAGISVLFNFAPLVINGESAGEITVIGFHEKLHQIRCATGRVDTFVVRILPFGFSRFSDIPVSSLTDKIVHGCVAFGDRIHELYNEMQNVKDFSSRASLIDTFFLERMKEPGPVDELIIQVAAQLRTQPETSSFESLNKKIRLPLSTRQMARKFKSTIGVTMRTYIRICRFETAKTLFFEANDHSLTSIGYLSGYYDQAHFSKEFKNLSGLNAKSFVPSCSLQKMLQK